MDTSTLRQNIQSFVEKFDRDKYHYLSRDYLEAQTRKDFIDLLFEALGWDISNRAGLPPFEREVLLERGETSGRPDYNFRLGGASKFFVEAKAPAESLDSVRHVLQAKSYAWNTKEVFIVVLTDFEGLRVFDASLPPDKKTPLQGLILDLKYTEYLDNLDKLLWLSREAVSQGSLERLLLKDAKSRRQRIPVDKKFLQDMTLWREELAKDVYRHDPSISVRTLNEVVQRLLDRIVFIRIAEDRKIIAPRTLFEIAQLWKAEGKKRPIQYHLNNLFREINADLNGDIFKPHAREQYEADSQLLAEIIEKLYFPNSPYLFDVIGVELLGSIYERYLGSTIRATPGGRVKVEEKQEVRKAGGVYYTPQYIVKYIVENTVGRLIEGKTPKQIEKIKILDPACGSGSFLLGAYQYLIDYHVKYYREHPREAHAHPLFPDLLQDSEGNHRLSIIKKGHILRNNLFGVDIDPQAVEITMMSLYLKALEGERTLPRKQGLLPVLSDNIKCGNSLIGYDVFEQGQLFSDEEKERINPFDWDSKEAGFGEIMERGGFDCVIGNPPYVSVENLEPTIRKLLMNLYESAIKRFDIYVAFIEKGLHIIKENGFLSYIIPYPFLNQNYAELLRQKITKCYTLCKIVDLSRVKVFEEVVVRNCIIVVKKTKPTRKTSVEIVSLSMEQEKTNLLDAEMKPMKQLSFAGLPKNMFRVDLTEDQERILQKIDKNSFKIGEICYVNWGARSGNVKKYITFKPIDKLSKKMIDARDIDRYFLMFDNKYLWYKKDELYNPMFEELFETPKLIIRDISGRERLKATYDEEGHYAEHTVSLCLLKHCLKSVCRRGLEITHEESERSKRWDLRFILGIFNSKLITAYFTWFLGGGLHVYPNDIKNLPLPKINFDNPKEKAMHDRLVTLVDRMLELQKKRHALPATSGREMVEREIAVTDEKIDDLVYELYGITKGERATIEEST